MSKVIIEVAGEGTFDDDEERRRFGRSDLLVQVEYSTVDEIFSEFTRDINEGGLLTTSKNGILRSGGKKAAAPGGMWFSAQAPIS